MRLRDLAAFAVCGGAFLLAAGCGGGKKNQPPALSTTTLAATEDSTLNAQLAATDPEGKAITFALGSGAQHGQVTVAASGAVNYVPAANYAGTDTFTVRVTDQKGLSSTGTVSVNVANVNDAPAITTTTLNATEDTVLAAQIVATDPDNSPLAFTLVTNAQHGMVSIPNGGPVSTTNSGAVSYTPDSNYFGADSFTVRVSDGAGGEVTGTVNIAVASVNDAPTLTSPQFVVSEDGSVSGQMTSTDIENENVQYSIATGAAHGQVVLQPNGALQYTPAPDYFGADQFVVTLSDGTASTQANVSLTVTPVNDAPVAADDELRLPFAASIAVPLLGNDHDVDGEVLQVSILTQPGGGTLSVTAPNSVSFAPDNAFNGPIRFTYRVTDAAGVTADATVRAVIGDFSGLYYLSDETTVGRAELHFFDGLQVSRISDALTAGTSVTSFAVSGDGSNVAYVVESATAAWVYAKAPDATTARLLYSEPANGGFPPVRVSLNHDGAFAGVFDPFAAGTRRIFIVRTADATVTPVGANDGQVVQIPSLIFNPANDDFYIQAQVGGSPPPMSGTGFMTLFRGSSASPADITRVGATYPPNTGGGGSGYETAISSDGRYVLHREADYSVSGGKYSVLVYDSVANSEAVMYRRPGVNEIGNWDGFSLSNDGARVCFKFLEAGASGSIGPGRMLVSSPATPAAAPVMSGVFPVIGGCSLAADSATTLFFGNNMAPAAYQLYALPAGGGTPTAVNRSFVGSEEIWNYFAAPSGGRFVFGTRASGNTNNLYSVAFDAPGTFIDFASGFFDDGSLPAKPDFDALLLAYSKRPAINSGLRRLTLLSTQSAGYSFSLTRADSSTGLQQFEWAP
jgi:VCBS repeat-containing protein